MVEGRVRRAGNILLLTAVIGCSSGPVTVAPRPPMTPSLLGSAKGSSCGFLLLNLVPMGVNGRVDAAHAEAQAALGTNEVVDVRVRERWYGLPLIGTVLCTDIEQTAAR